jgi:hypothetical protein
VNPSKMVYFFFWGGVALRVGAMFADSRLSIASKVTSEAEPVESSLTFEES